MIYRGAGFWVPFVPFGVFLATIFVQEQIVGKIEHYRWLTGLILIVSGVILSWWGKKLNRPLDSIVMVTRTEEGMIAEVRPDARHSLYGIRMEYWGLLCLVIGVIYLVYGLGTAS